MSSGLRELAIVLYAVTLICPKSSQAS